MPCIVQQIPAGKRQIRPTPSYAWLKPQSKVIFATVLSLATNGLADGQASLDTPAHFAVVEAIKLIISAVAYHLSRQEQDASPPEQGTSISLENCDHDEEEGLEVQIEQKHLLLSSPAAKRSGNRRLTLFAAVAASLHTARVYLVSPFLIDGSTVLTTFETRRARMCGDISAHYHMISRSRSRHSAVYFCCGSAFRDRSQSCSTKMRFCS